MYTFLGGTCGSKQIVNGSMTIKISPCYKGRVVQEIADKLEVVEDWEQLAGWLDIKPATVNN